MSIQGHRLAAERRAYGQQIALYCAHTEGDGVNRYAQPVSFEDGPQGALVDPFLLITEDEAQGLIDELWRCGLRPTQGKQSEGVNNTQEKHLEDMRAIAFAKLKVSAP